MPRGQPWFRLYADIIHNPKLLGLPENIRWRYVAILCLKCAGHWPPKSEKSAAILLNCRGNTYTKTFNALVSAGLLEATGDVHNWDNRQYKSDISTERVREWRARQRKRNVSETDTETDTDTDIYGDTTVDNRGGDRDGRRPPGVGKEKQASRKQLDMLSMMAYQRGLTLRAAVVELMQLEYPPRAGDVDRIMERLRGMRKLSDDQLRMLEKGAQHESITARDSAVGKIIAALANKKRA